MLGLFLLVLVVWFYGGLLLRTPHYVDTPFCHMRKDYFDRTGLSSKLPKK
jgi:hypothetical protein